jgi:hypothetical protein
MDVQCDAVINNTKTLIRFYPDIQNVHLIRDGPFNLQGCYGFFLTLGYMTKTLNQIIFFPSTKIRIFFSTTLGIRIFF